jgi:hypothetical protein
MDKAATGMGDYEWFLQQVMAMGCPERGDR